MKKFKKTKIITALCSALTIIGTTLFLVSCSDNAIQQQTDSKVSEQGPNTTPPAQENKNTEQQPLTKIELHDAIQNIINEVIQEDNGSYQNEEEKNEINKKVEEIAKKIFNGEFNFWGDTEEWGLRIGKLLQQKYIEIFTLPGFYDATLNPVTFNNTVIDQLKTEIKAAKLKVKEQFIQQVKDVAKQIVQNKNNKTKAQQIAQESGEAKAIEFLKNEIKQEINKNIAEAGTSWARNNWNLKILYNFWNSLNFLTIFKNSSLKVYVENIEKILKVDDYQETYLNWYKYGTLAVLDKGITDEKVRTKVKKIVTKVFENEKFQKSFLDRDIAVLFCAFFLRAILQGLEELELIENTIQDIVYEIIKEDENNNEINTEVKKIIKIIFDNNYKFPQDDAEWNKKFKKLIYEQIARLLTLAKTYENIIKPTTFNDIAINEIRIEKAKVKEQFIQQVKDVAKQIVQNKNNKTEAQQKAQESGVEEAEKFLKNKIKQEINKNISNGNSGWKKDEWDEKIFTNIKQSPNVLTILKNSSLKVYVEELEAIINRKDVQEIIFNNFKYGTLSALDNNTNWWKIRNKNLEITNKKVRTKVKKIVTKVFETRTFQKEFLRKQIISLIYEIFSSSIKKGIEN